MNGQFKSKQTPAQREMNEEYFNSKNMQGQNGSIFVLFYLSLSENVFKKDMTFFIFNIETTHFLIRIKSEKRGNHFLKQIVRF